MQRSAKKYSGDSTDSTVPRNFILDVPQIAAYHKKLKHCFYFRCNSLTIVAELLVKHLEWSRVAEVVETVDKALLAYKTAKVY